MTSERRRTDVDTTWKRFINVDTTLFLVIYPLGLIFLKMCNRFDMNAIDRLTFLRLKLENDFKAGKRMNR